MAGVLVQLIPASLVDSIAMAIAVASLAILIRFPIHTTWLVLAGAGVGLLKSI